MKGTAAGLLPAVDLSTPLATIQKPLVISAAASAGPRGAGGGVSSPLDGDGARIEASMRERARSGQGTKAPAASSLLGGSEFDGPRGWSSARVPWIERNSLAPPPDLDSVLGPRGFQPSPWPLFQLESRFDAPEHCSQAENGLLFYCPPPRKRELVVAAERILRRKYFSEVRRHIKRQWRQQFLATPTMSFFTYDEGVHRINQIGRREEDGYGEAEHFTNEFRDDLFRNPDREGEEDFELLAYGPFIVMDSGSVRLDLGRAIHLDDGEPEEKVFQPMSRTVLASREYEVKTSLRLGFDPGTALKTGDMSWVVDRYGINVEVAWLSDVLGREMVATEIETQIERNGDFAAIVNFVFKSR